MTHCRVCEATTTAFLCKPCVGEISRALDDLPSMLHEVSILATKQTRVYRANGTSHTSNETTDAEYDEAERWEWLALPAQLRSRTAKSSLPATATMVNLGARDLYDATVNMLVGWARHLAESRGVALEIATGRRVGPTCAPHAHDFTDAGCGLDPDSCKRLHPEHVHDYTPKGCGVGRDHEGNFRCRTPLHCRHDSCVDIRAGSAIGTNGALAAWLLANLNAIRFDEAASEIHRDLTRQHSRMRRAVDRIPSRVFAGPCEEQFPDHADVCRRPLYATPQPHFDTDEERERWETDNPIICDGYRPPFDRSDGYDPNDEGCGTEHTREARRVWQLDDVEDRLLPWSLWEELLPDIARHLAWPHRTTWVRWRKHVQIKTVIDGTEFYRGGDVIDHCYREQGRIKGNTDRARRGRLSA